MSLTENELWKTCPPRRTLDIISQYRPQIELLEKLRAGESVKPPKYHGGEEMVRLVESQLRGKNVAIFKPIELLSRIHKTIRSTKGETELIQEVSVPIHYGPNNKELIIKTTPTEVSPEAMENLPNAYYAAIQSIAARNAKKLAQQNTTFEDSILINRRLIEKNLRCVRCNINHTVSCFKYDWLTGRLL